MADQGVFGKVMCSPIVSGCRFAVAYKASGGIHVCEISMIRLAAGISDPIVPEQCPDDKGGVADHQGKAGDTKTLRAWRCRFKDELAGLECHRQFPRAAAAQRTFESGKHASVSSYARGGLLGHLSAKAHPVPITKMVPKRTNSPRVPKTPGCKTAVAAKKVPASNTAKDRKSATSLSVMSASRRDVAGEVNHVWQELVKPDLLDGEESLGFYD